MDGGSGMAIEVFDVSNTTGAGTLDADRLRADLERAVAGELLLDARLAELEKAYARGKRAVAARPPAVRVLVDEAASAVATVIEVRAPDSRGLLYRLTRVLAGCGLDVLSARMSTMGHEVVDAFYVRQSGTGIPPTTEALQPIISRLAAEASSPAE
jgi:[protein-PII] uridylyltransferase